MSSMFHASDNHRTPANFGFFGNLVNSGYVYEFVDKDNRPAPVLMWNISVALNIIPIIGNILAGIIHIIGAFDGESWNREALVRGIVELTIVGGIALAIVDIAFTVGRMCTDKT